jgi:hypothetical protein
MVDHTPPDLIGAALGALATAGAGVLGWLGLRAQAKAAKPAADPQAVQNDGWNDLLDQMRQELKAASGERNHLNAVLEEERRAWRVEREAWRVEREAFLGKINQLQAVAEGFERLLRRNGIELPPRHVYTPEPAKIVETTLRQEGLGDEE